MRRYLRDRYHHLFYQIFKFKWRNPFISASKILFRGKHPKRVLGIWDFESGRAVFGDAIYFHEILQVIAEQNQLDKVDCCFINPAIRDFTKNRYQVTDPATIDGIISLTKINPKIGSVFIFDDNNQFASFFRTFKDAYVVFPNPFTPFAPVSNMYFITDFFEEHRYLPKLSLDQPHLSWARSFFSKHCANKIPFCVAMRKNTRDPSRNAPIEEWRRFFRFCLHQYPDFIFVVVGTEHEIDPELEEMNNIVFAKRYNTTLLQDMAILQISTAFLTHSSGIAPLAYFCGGTPCLMFGIDDRHIHFGHAYRGGRGYNFASEDHGFFSGPYTAEEIIQRFEELVKDRHLAPGNVKLPETR